MTNSGFAAYSHALQGIGEAVHRLRWWWPVGKVPEVGVSPLVYVFWEEFGIEFPSSCIKLCWEVPLRSIFRRRERGPVAYVITFVDEIAMWVPSLDAWDQFVWPPAAAMPWATMEVEQYGYCCDQAIDLRPVMPVTQFRVTDEAGTYWCVARALVFKGNVLAYNPTRDEAEWVPMCGVTNDLSWVEEKSTMALANYVPCTSKEGACIVRLGACHLMSWSNNSSSTEEQEEEGEEGEHEEGEEWEEVGPEPPSSNTELEQGVVEEEPERSRDWGSTMEEEECLTFNDLQSDSYTTADGHSPRCVTPRELGSPGEMAVKVHTRELEVEEL